MFQIFNAASFASLWYWVLHIVVWTLVCYRTLGVPHDLLLRARRVPEAAGTVEMLAHLASERIAGVHERLGAVLAAVAGFLLAALFALGFLSGLEAAQAAFLLLLPLACVWYSVVRLAIVVRRFRMRGPKLVLALARRRTWHQFIAILAMLAATAVARALKAPAL